MSSSDTTTSARVLRELETWFEEVEAERRAIRGGRKRRNHEAKG